MTRRRVALLAGFTATLLAVAGQNALADTAAETADTRDRPIVCVNLRQQDPEVSEICLYYRRFPH